MADNIPRDKPITTWIKFGYPEETTIDKSLFRPLNAWKDDWIHLCYGEITESPGESMLLICWKLSQAWARFAGSSDCEELLANLKAHSDDTLEIQVIDFDRDFLSQSLSSHGEVRTVYFSASISSQKRDALSKVHCLVTMVGYGKSLQHLSPYISPPSSGWIGGTQTWEGGDAVACVWVHKWKNKGAEVKFKTTERQAQMKGGELFKPLTVDLFEQDLRDLGALGWNDYHVNFKKTAFIP